MVITHLLDGMILQVPSLQFDIDIQNSHIWKRKMRKYMFQPTIFGTLNFGGCRELRQFDLAG